MPKTQKIKKEKQQKKKEELRKIESEVPKEYLAEFRQWQPIPIHKYYGTTVKFGVLTDTHIGSLYTKYDVLNLAYKVFKKEKIDTVYHCGDKLIVS